MGGEGREGKAERGPVTRDIAGADLVGEGAGAGGSSYHHLHGDLFDLRLPLAEAHAHHISICRLEEVPYSFRALEIGTLLCSSSVPPEKMSRLHRPAFPCWKVWWRKLTSPLLGG